ncbi:aldose epimerase family protein [Flavihumibacter fluvii]|uniref:aldose epimerase family protein n=1 Tax=Flavihumibacter fluvii TaxID=2838157 RepID=UPI001BDEA0DD|nr:aldose epimerase family protein [Flavihumibacter fluvii]ULQ51907.1 galactose mutarotase [Flavihumibacter fluvii]
MKFITQVLFAGCIFTAMLSCNNNTKNETVEAEKTTSGTSRKEWGNIEGQPVYLYTLSNAKGTVVNITNYGGIVTSFVTKDKQGVASSIVLGFDSLAPYLQKHPYFGAIIGRYGNRIGDAKFSIGKEHYTLAANNGKNALHGGLKGFDKVIWSVDPPVDSVPSITLHYMSKDGEEGYPGNLNVTVKYTLGDNDDLSIVYDATTDKATPVNLTNHSYFNLSGDVKETILGHEVQINANSYTPVDTTLITTGEITSVKGTPFDFTTPQTVGSRIDAVTGNPGGYDHNYVLNRQGTGLETAATVYDPVSGRVLEVKTTEPGMQFYTGNFLDGSVINHTGTPVNFRTALCLETQHFPDSPNKPAFPTTILQPGETYHSETVYTVSLRK